jgi:hypothetical protein
MDAIERCERCGHAVETLRHPLRRLRWSGYWWEGVKSLFTGPLKVCDRCGAIYASDGHLMAAGAVETDAEHRLDVFRRDMAYLRDSFAGVVVAGELAAFWLARSTVSPDIVQVALAAAVGAAALLPFGYFARKARSAKRDLVRLREARRRGMVPVEQGDSVAAKLVTGTENRES